MELAGSSRETRRILNQTKRELVKAIQKDDSRKVKTIINGIRSLPDEQNWIDEPLETNGQTALHVAVSAGHEEIVEALLDFGADVNVVTVWQETPLHLAAENQFVSVVDLLLERSECEVRLKSKKNDETALHIAARVGCADAVKSLIDRGAVVDEPDRRKDTPLHYAVLKSHHEAVRELLVAGADPKARNEQGRTPLYISMKLLNDKQMTAVLLKGNQTQTNAKVPEKVTVQNNKWNSSKPRQGRPLPPPIQKTKMGMSMSRPPRTSVVEKPLPMEQIAESSREVFLTELKESPHEKPSKSTDTPIQHIGQQNVPPEPEPARRPNRRVNLKSASTQVDPPRRRGFAQHVAQSRVSTVERPLDDCYRMENNPRGICLLFNNETYWHDDFQERSGADVDERRMEKVFKTLGFKVKIHKNLNASEMFWEVVNIAKTDHSKHDCFVCCILSHGTLGTIFGIDGDSCKISDLTVSLTSRRCPSLARKPKLFFIQACRGDDYQAGLEGEDHHDATGRADLGAMVPDHADFLLGYATMARFRAQRHKSNGSVYIQTLCELLENEYSTNDLLSILTKVNARVSEVSFRATDGACFTQMPEVRHSLTKKVKF